MLTTEQFLQEIHEIAASTKPDEFEAAIQQRCVLWAREIKHEELEIANEPDQDPDC